MVAVVLAAPAAAEAVTYRGTATSTDRDFKYGAVRVVVRNSRVTRLTIESVTTTGCGGFMTLVFNPRDRGARIVRGSARISRRGRFFVRYRPDRTVEDQSTQIRARFSGRRVTGSFRSGDLCVNAGYFSARR